MSDITTLMMAAAGVGGAEETDPNFNQTVLLLHGDGSNGAQNNTFVDSSTNNFTVTRNGNTTQGTFSPFSAPDGRWSNYFDGNSSYLRTTSTLGVASNEFTMGFWFYPLSSSVVGLFDSGPGEANCFRNYPANNIEDQNTSPDVSIAGAYNVNAWNWMCITKSGTSYTVYINGTSVGTGTCSNPMAESNFTIGAINGGSEGYFNGYISNFIFVDGSASVISVPNAPSTAISGTSFLTCQSNRFVDNSSNAFAITANGDVKVTPFSPFAPTAAYDPAVNGGSGYFDSVDDFLTAGSAANWNFLHNGNAWTIQFFMYMLSTSSQYGLVSTELGSGSYGMTLIANANTGASTEAGTLLLRVSKGTSGTYEVNFDIENFFVANQWSYISVSFDGVDTYNFYRDGVLIDTHVNASPSYAANDATNALHIGASVAGGTASRDFSGYLSSLKISDVVVSGLTSIPTAPFTSDANTELLLNLVNAGIFDNTGKNNLETVGNAQIDTTTKKYGTGSMEFDGTGDYLRFVSTPDTTFGTGDLTIEGWFYSNNIATTQVIFERRAALGKRGLIAYLDSSKFYFEAGDTSTTVWEVSLSSGTLSSSTWYHFAATRSGDTWRAFVGGTQIGSDTTWSGSVVDETSNWLIGIRYDGAVGFNGFIDDLRISRVARYTTTFTPPTKAFYDL